MNKRILGGLLCALSVWLVVDGAPAAAARVRPLR